VNGVDQVLAEWNLEPKAADFLRNIKFADAANYHSLGFDLQRSTGSVEEYVASGTNTNGRIILSFMKGSASGVALFPPVYAVRCRRVLFVRRCKTYNYPRPLNAGELMVI
jgi:hypothetical protein